MRSNLSAVIVLVDDKETFCIEVAHDGHPQYAGRTLLNNYPDYETLFPLIMGGDLKWLGPTIEQSQSYYIEDLLRNPCVSKEEYSPKLLENRTLDSFLESEEAIKELLDDGASFLYVFATDCNMWFMSDKGLLLRPLTAVETV